LIVMHALVVLLAPDMSMEFDCAMLQICIHLSFMTQFRIQYLAFLLKSVAKRVLFLNS
jgi:hypothetical protein